MDAAAGRAMGDVSSVWVLQLLELFRHTGDRALLAELYPHVPWAAAWMVRSCIRMHACGRASGRAGGRTGGRAGGEAEGKRRASELRDLRFFSPPR